MKYKVYIHTCPNGKKYVGVTSRTLEKRWKKGQGYRYNKHFYSAVLKYGWDNITHEVFEVSSEEEMYQKEIELIAQFHTNNPEYGYNNSTGGEKGALGCHHSYECRKKRMGKPLSEETKKKISEALTGKVIHYQSEETRRKLSNLRRGKSLSEEHKRKISEALKGKPKFGKTESEYLKRLSEPRKGKPKSQETKEKMRLHALSRPKIKILLQDGTVREMNKASLTRNFINRKIPFEYVS